MKQPNQTHIESNVSVFFLIQLNGFTETVSEFKALIIKFSYLTNYNCRVIILISASDKICGPSVIKLVASSFLSNFC